jgi:hypothetical protein
MTHNNILQKCLDVQEPYVPGLHYMATKSASPANALISCQVLSFIKESRKKKCARKNGNILVKYPARTWIVIHQV